MPEEDIEQVAEELWGTPIEEPRMTSSSSSRNRPERQIVSGFNVNGSTIESSDLNVYGGMKVHNGPVDVYQGSDRIGGTLFFDQRDNTMKVYDDKGKIRNVVFDFNTGVFTMDEEVEKPNLSEEYMEPIEDRSEILDIR